MDDTEKEMLKALVDRFLQWELPKTVSSDSCVTEPNYPHSRTGTNLLTADEAAQMLTYVLALNGPKNLLQPSATSSTEGKQS